MCKEKGGEGFLWGELGWLLGGDDVWTESEGVRGSRRWVMAERHFSLYKAWRYYFSPLLSESIPLQNEHNSCQWADYCRSEILGAPEKNSSGLKPHITNTHLWYVVIIFPPLHSEIFIKLLSAFVSFSWGRGRFCLNKERGIWGGSHVRAVV